MINKIIKELNWWFFTKLSFTVLVYSFTAWSIDDNMQWYDNQPIYKSLAIISFFTMLSLLALKFHFENKKA